MLADDLDLVASPFGPADIHAFEHLRPVLAFGAARAGMNLDIGVIAVGLAREQRLHFPGVSLLPQAVKRLLSFRDDVRVPLLLAEFDERNLIVELSDNAVKRAERAFDPLALTHQALGAAAVVPEIRGLGLAIELSQSQPRAIGVKDASGARRAIL